MSDPKEEKKKIEMAKKEIKSAVKKLSLKMRKPVIEAKKLIDEKKTLEKTKKNGPEEKKKIKKIDLQLGAILKKCEKEAGTTGKLIDLTLKNYVPDEKDALPLWQKGMSNWYIDYLKKEPGLAIGGGLRLNGDLSIKKKQASFMILGKF